MTKEIPYNQLAADALEVLSKGAFLTTTHNGKVNTMTIAWGSIGFMWGKPVFMAMVRPSRFSYELLEASQEFSISIPFKNQQAALAICGSKSGRDIDKITEAGLETVPGQKISTPIIAQCQLHYECKVVYTQPMAAEHLTPAANEQWYPGNANYHTLYFGEIVASYTRD